MPGTWARVVVVTLVLVPFVYAAARWVGVDYTPVQDQAVAALRVSDLWTADAPLVGAFSRYGWSHPGPIWFLVLAPFEAVGGSVGMVVGSILVTGCVLAVVVDLVWRRLGGLAATISILALALAIAGVDAFGIVVPWNPNLAWPLYTLFLVLLLLVAIDRRLEDLAIAVFVACVLVQLHVGYALLAGLPLIATTLMLPWTNAAGRRRIWHGIRGRRAWLWLVIGALIWLPPILEQLLNGREGNLAKISRWFLVRDAVEAGERVGLPAGLGFLGGALHIPPVGLGYAGEEVEPFTGWMIAGGAWRILPLVAVLTVGTWLATRGREHGALRVSFLAWVVLVTGVLSASLVVGDRWPYLFTWRYPLVFFVLSVACAQVGCSWRSRHRVIDVSWLRFALPGSCAVFVLVALVVVARWEPGQIRAIEPDVAELLSQIDPPAKDRVIEVRQVGPILDGVGDAVLLHGEHEGWSLGAPRELGFKFGEHRVAPPTASTWLVTQGSSATSLALAIPGAKPVARTSPLSPRLDNELVQAHVDAAEALEREGRLDLLDALGSDLVSLVLDEAGVEVPDQTVRTLERLNQQVSDAQRPRLAIVDIGPVTAPEITDVLALIQGK